MKKIVVTGRGGVGKSSFAAILLRFLAAPTLVVDLDPDLSIGRMLGADGEKKTLCEVLYEALKEREAGRHPTTSVEDLFFFSLFRDAIYEGKGFDLLTLGFKDLEGCYCFPDYLLKKAVERLLANYRNLLADSPAGLEHLNRNIISEIDHLFVLIDPSEKSIRHVEKVREVARAVGIRFGNFHVVANHMFTQRDQAFVEDAGIQLVGRLVADPLVEKLNLEGQPLLSLEESSPYVASVKRIVERAGIG